jgi:transcriptional regulator with XRE-family HTH domain
MEASMSVFSKRLKAARLMAEYSQETLGVLAGIDEMSASARMNQYERAKHTPDYSMVERLSNVLNVPESYFYEKDDEIATLLVTLHRVAPTERKKLTNFFLQHINSADKTSTI